MISFYQIMICNLKIMFTVSRLLAGRRSWCAWWDREAQRLCDTDIKLFIRWTVIEQGISLTYEGTHGINLSLMQSHAMDGGRHECGCVVVDVIILMRTSSDLVAREKHAFKYDFIWIFRNNWIKNRLINANIWLNAS